MQDLGTWNFGASTCGAGLLSSIRLLGTWILRGFNILDAFLSPPILVIGATGSP